MIRQKLIPIIHILIIIFTFFFIWLSFPPQVSPEKVFLMQGMTPSQFADILEEKEIVRSAFVLRGILKVKGDADKLAPGEYLFEKRQSVFDVAKRIATGDYKTEQRWVTIPEGSTNIQIADLISQKFSDFNRDKFLDDAKDKQGYLFPDTYRFLSTSTKSIIADLSDTFNFKVRNLQSTALDEGKDWNEIVIMASILEEEADTEEDFKIVSGILWKRLKIGMPLQVDVATSTYEKIGFPDAPLSNPGLLTIESALRPASTTHLYYLTGRDGLMHYADTYEKHQANIKVYLK